MPVWGWILLLLFGLLIFGILLCYFYISFTAQPYLFDEVETLPYGKTALLLGTAKLTKKGQNNLFFIERIIKTAEAYHSGKVDQILISGAGHKSRSDEVNDILPYLLERGVEHQNILADHRGNRTWNSILHCKTQFKISSPLIVSQRFHNQRAVFIALKMGLDPIAVNAPMVTGKIGRKMILREALARVKCMMDCLWLRKDLSA